MVHRIGQFLMGVLRYLGAAAIFLWSGLTDGWNYLERQDWREFRERCERAGIAAIVIVVILILLTVAGFYAGLNGYLRTMGWCLSYTVIGLLLVMWTVKFIFAAIATVAFAVEMVWLITVNPAVWAFSATGNKLGSAISWPFRSAQNFMTKFMIGVSSLKKKPEEIEELLRIIKEQETNPPTSKSFSEAMAGAKAKMKEAKEHAIGIAAAVIGWLEMALAMIIFTGLLVAFAKGLALDESLGWWHTIGNVFAVWFAKPWTIPSLLGLAFMIYSSLGLNHQEQIIKRLYYKDAPKGLELANSLEISRHTKNMLYIPTIVGLIVVLVLTLVSSTGQEVATEQYALVRIDYQTESPAISLKKGEVVLVAGQTRMADSLNTRFVKIRQLDLATFDPKSKSTAKIPRIDLLLLSKEDAWALTHPPDTMLYSEVTAGDTLMQINYTWNIPVRQNDYLRILVEPANDSENDSLHMEIRLPGSSDWKHYATTSWSGFISQDGEFHVTTVDCKRPMVTSQARVYAIIKRQKIRVNT